MGEFFLPFLCILMSEGSDLIHMRGCEHSIRIGNYPGLMMAVNKCLI